jgi:hypothetical protein
MDDNHQPTLGPRVSSSHCDVASLYQRRTLIPQFQVRLSRLERLPQELLQIIFNNVQSNYTYPPPTLSRSLRRIQERQAYKHLRLRISHFKGFCDSLRSTSDDVSSKGGLVRSMELLGNVRRSDEYCSTLATHFPHLNSFRSMSRFGFPDSNIIHLAPCTNLQKLSLHLLDGSMLAQLLRIRGVKEITVNIGVGRTRVIPTITAAAIPNVTNERHQLEHLKIEAGYLDSSILSFLQSVQASTLSLKVYSGDMSSLLTYLSPTTTTHLLLSAASPGGRPLAASDLTSFIYLESLELDGQGIHGDSTLFTTTLESLESLEKLTIGRYFNLDGQHLIEAISLSGSLSLKKIVINALEVSGPYSDEVEGEAAQTSVTEHAKIGSWSYIWPVSCPPSTLKDLSKLAVSKGITLSGDLIDAVRRSEQYEKLAIKKKKIIARMEMEVADLHKRMSALENEISNQEDS